MSQTRNPCQAARFKCTSHLYEHFGNVRRPADVASAVRAWFRWCCWAADRLPRHWPSARGLETQGLWSFVPKDVHGWPWQEVGEVCGRMDDADRQREGGVRTPVRSSTPGTDELTWLSFHQPGEAGVPTPIARWRDWLSGEANSLHTQWEVAGVAVWASCARLYLSVSLTKLH